MAPRLIVSTDCTLAELMSAASAGRLFAVLDACDTPTVPEKIEEIGPDRGVSLYSGTSSEALCGIAPYLVQVNGEIFHWIQTNLFGQPWGIFLLVQSSMAEVRKHLRKFLIVQNAEGKELYFRFYDPRVLSTFILSCDPEQVTEFFGPVQKYVCAPDPAVPVKLTGFEKATGQVR